MVSTIMLSNSGSWWELMLLYLESELVVCQHSKEWVVYRDCRGCVHQLGFFSHSPWGGKWMLELDQEFWFQWFYLHMLHNMNTNWLMMSGCIPGQSLISFNWHLSLATTTLTTNYVIFLHNKINAYISI